MVSLMTNPLDAMAENIKIMHRERSQNDFDIEALEKEKGQLVQVLDVVFVRMVEQNSKIGRKMQERQVYDKAIAEMEQAFGQIVHTSATLTQVARREIASINRQKHQMDLVEKGVSIEEQLSQSAQASEEREFRQRQTEMQQAGGRAENVARPTMGAGLGNTMNRNGLVGGGGGGRAPPRGPPPGAPPSERAPPNWQR